MAAIAKWPGKIRAGRRTTQITSSMDIFPTILKQAGVDLPTDRIIDGLDLSPILFSQSAADGPYNNTHKTLIHYLGTKDVYAVTQGPYKVRTGPQFPTHSTHHCHAQ